MSNTVTQEYFKIVFKLGVTIVVVLLVLHLPVPVQSKVCTFENRPWRGVFDTTLLDKVCE